MNFEEVARKWLINRGMNANDVQVDVLSFLLKDVYNAAIIENCDFRKEMQLFKKRWESSQLIRDGLIKTLFKVRNANEAVRALAEKARMLDRVIHPFEVLDILEMEELEKP